jgi:hypothetical protein
MNERIMKLIEKAGWRNAYTDPKDGFEPVFEGEERNLACIEKFAELIVRDCINIAYEYDKPKLSGPGLAIASNIESHFDIYIEEDGRFVK